MCDPGLIMAATTMYTMSAQRQQANYQSQVARNNAKTQEYMAQDATARGERGEQAHRLNVARIKSEQRAAFGASGVDVQSGSPLEAISDTAMLGELDALTIRSNAEREAYGYRTGASNYMAQSKLDRMKGRQAAVGTLLSGAGRVSKRWHQPGKGQSKDDFPYDYYAGQRDLTLWREKP